LLSPLGDLKLVIRYSNVLLESSASRATSSGVTDPPQITGLSSVAPSRKWRLAPFGSRSKRDELLPESTAVLERPRSRDELTVFGDRRNDPAVVIGRDWIEARFLARRRGPLMVGALHGVETLHRPRPQLNRYFGEAWKSRTRAYRSATAGRRSLPSWAAARIVLQTVSLATKSKVEAKPEERKPSRLQEGPAPRRGRRR
jgi:hypothetical protein